MRIAINTRLLLKNRLEGIGWFTHESLSRITRNHPEHDFFFLFDRKYDDSFIYSDNIYPVVVSPQSRHPFLWYLWFEKSIPKVLDAIDAELFISPDNYFSLKTKVPGLVVIHDINFYHDPKNIPFLARKFYNHYVPLYAKAAKRIATVSNFSKNDIASSYQISKHKIDVLYNGASDLYRPLDEAAKTKIKRTLSGGEDYFLFVGALNPRKNVHRLFMAFDEFRKEFSSNIKLVIVGEKMYWSNEIKKSYEKMRFKDQVIFTGRQNQSSLKDIVGASLGLTLVSTYEGFGIPVVEAMYSETAVLVSNVTALPEVAGEATIYADPFSISSIKDGLLQLAKDKNLRNKLIVLGKEQRKKFTWDKTSQHFWDSIEKCFPIS
ncbi:MAG: glycosyltransferase family 4 protein [Bacteroidota bacterium]